MDKKQSTAVNRRSRSSACHAMPCHAHSFDFPKMEYLSQRSWLRSGSAFGARHTCGWSVGFARSFPPKFPHLPVQPVQSSSVQKKNKKISGSDGSTRNKGPWIPFLLEVSQRSAESQTQAANIIGKILSHTRTVQSVRCCR